jgi:hypothetical protein
MLQAVRQSIAFGSDQPQCDNQVEFAGPFGAKLIATLEHSLQLDGATSRSHFSGCPSTLVAICSACRSSIFRVRRNSFQRKQSAVISLSVHPHSIPRTSMMACESHDLVCLSFAFLSEIRQADHRLFESGTG